MIIKYPTGLYKDALPIEPSDSTSVTYTISNELPPRTKLVFPKIPVGSYGRKRELSQVTKIERRAVVGDLLFTVSSARRQTSDDTTKQYQTGQVLDFSSSPTKSVDPMLVASITETRHDINRFDYNNLGVSNDEVQLINDGSLKTYDKLVDSLNSLRVLRSDAEAMISVNQKKVNEASKNIDALMIIAYNNQDDEDVRPLISKFEKIRSDAQAEINIAVNNANEYSRQSTQVLDDLRKVMTVLT